MNRNLRQPIAKATWRVVLALAIPLLLGATLAGATTIRYLDDGAVQHPTNGGWVLPAQGTCPSGAANGYADIDTRPECVALRLNIVQGSCTSANFLSWTTGGVCNDTLATDQATCEAKEDRLWNPGTGVCSIKMEDDDRNNVVCALHNGTWSTAGTCTGAWVNGDRTAYTPTLLTGNSAGDQCLRCHNDLTQYNGPRLRDTEETLLMGHKNMSRKVTVGQPWGGPPFSCSVNPVVNTTPELCAAALGTWQPDIYPGTDGGQLFDWINGTVKVGGVDKPLLWIYGDWLAALPRAVYGDDPNTAATPDAPKVSYSCGRCHTTGWTSDATVTPVNADPRVTKEPERSFPGVTWNGTSDAVFGQVNLKGGVTGDSNLSSSWDVWGISCTRCHNSAVDLDNPVAASNPIQYNAPAGMSTHHNGMTAATVSTSGDKGYCTDTRFTARAQCDAVGGAWLTACTVAGVCSDTTYKTSGACVAAAGTWTPYTDKTTCNTGGGTWLPDTVGCSLAGVCNDPAITTQAACTGTVASGPLTGLVRQWAATTDIIRCEDAGGHYTGSMLNRGQVITRMCMDCHRQETGGLPYDTANPGGNIKVGPAHGTVSLVSHPAGNEFLNSPHGKFSGSFDQIATSPFAYFGSPRYGSHFINDGEAANTGNGCTGCHEVHTSTVTGGESAFREECTECHTKDVNQIVHPTGVGTPIVSKSEPFEACIACHMPEGRHLFRINSSASYSTFPMPAALTTTVNANTASDDGYAAVWVDLDLACGQCHGGGTEQAVGTGSMTATSKTLTVADSSLYTVGEKIEVKGAGGFYYDEEGSGYANVDLETYIAAIPSSTTLTLVGAATVAVTDAEVTQNAVKNNAAYFTKTELAGYAKGIHNDKPIAYFSYKLGNPNTLSISVDASASTCSGSVANCNAFSWNWGDGSPNGSGLTATHTYAAAGTYPVTLTATQYSIGSGTRTVNISVYTPDLPPTVGGTCSIDPNTWVATVTDTSTDTGGIAQVVVNWGDNSVVSNDTTSPFGPFTHTYIQPGNFTVSKKVVDSIGQQSTQTCVLSPAYFNVSGTVTNAAAVPVRLAAITVKKGVVTIRTVYSDAAGNYVVGNLKPGTYSLTAKKTGLNFPLTPVSVTVGPNGTANFQSSN